MPTSEQPVAEVEKIDGVTVLRSLPVDDLASGDRDAMEGVWDTLYEFRRAGGKVLVLDLGAGHLAPERVDRIWARAAASAERMPKATRRGPIPVLARARRTTYASC